MRNDVLTVRDSEHSVADSVGGIGRVWKAWEKVLGGTEPVSWPYFPRGGNNSKFDYFGL